MAFVHLHVHTHYSILDGLSNIDKLFTRAEQLGMPGLAITDHGNMYGVKEFVDVAAKHPSVKPILGCEIYVTRHYDHQLKDTSHRSYYHLILLAKNYQGYKNLIKIVSTGHIEGMYYGKPRVSHEIVEKYHEGLVCCSACLAGEIPRGIIAGDIAGVSKAIEWHKQVFGEDYYLEVMLHKTEIPGLSQNVYENQKICNAEIFSLAAKHGVKVVATNDVHFILKEDGPIHDRLICLTTNADFSDPDRLRYTQQEYLKSEEEMLALFPDHPEVISNTMEVFDKIESYEINRKHVLPKFEIDPGFLSGIDAYLEKYKDIIDAGRNDEEGNYRGDEFCNSVAYLAHLTYLGSVDRYGEHPDQEILKTLDFELKTISRMGFPDYFLIVQDFIGWARRNGVMVGPGRGSAAGSAVAYCLGITNLDPLRYGLLFERFLNPDRVSMPDIDVDFDDEGRYKVIQYVQERYGKDHISHVITFGKMAAKLAVKDVARISNLPGSESNRLTKMIPDRAWTVKEKGEDKTIKPTLANCIKYLPEMRNEYENGDPLVKEVLYYAMQLEGCIRQVGIHACAMIIGRGNLTDFIPITLGVDAASGQEVWVSQYEGSRIEDVGMLKMDFLGLKTLSIISRCLDLVKKRRGGPDIDIEKIPIDDPKVYELYSRGDTKSVFQFESNGMKDWLMRLHPSRFEDLIAMNALYRPGPMDYIPNFVNRKQGKEEIAYDLPDMEEYLSETYGVTVYQEQVMLLSRKLAGFSRGKSDKLRKAMGKKQITVLEGLHDDFIRGGLENGHPQAVLDKIWQDWRAFAEYAFNKSHATCYAWVSYQTAWLKAHYPEEFQASNLTQNQSNMTELQEIMADCKKGGISVLNPDINESESAFSVNKNGEIRFGLSGLHGFGENISSAIIEERNARGPFADIYDFVERMGHIVNRRSMEILIYAGCFDSFGIRRSAFFTEGTSKDLFLDELMRYADMFRHCSSDSTTSLFGEADEMKPVRPAIPVTHADEDILDLLQKEKEVVGMYLSSHPLDRYAFEIEKFTNCKMADIQAMIDESNRTQKGCSVKVAGIVTDVKNLTTRTGSPWAKITVEDFSGTYEFALFGKDVENFLPFMSLHSNLFIEAEITERYVVRKEDRDNGKTASYTAKIRKISLLGNVAADLVSSFNIAIDSSRLDGEFRRGLTKLLREYKGSTPLTVRLSDKEIDISVDLVSRKFQVTVCEALMNALGRMGIAYSVSSKYPS